MGCISLPFHSQSFHLAAHQSPSSIQSVNYYMQCPSGTWFLTSAGPPPSIHYHKHLCLSQLGLLQVSSCMYAKSITIHMHYYSVLTFRMFCLMRLERLLLFWLSQTMLNRIIPEDFFAWQYSNVMFQKVAFVKE